MKKIGILGGTFDPPHLGHLLIAEEVREKLDLEEVWFIPSFTPPHKEDLGTTPNDRMNMVKYAISNNPFFKLNTIEIERSGKSYTIDTIKRLKELHPDHDFYFIIGADMVEFLPNWFKIEELVNLVQFVGVKRAGSSLVTDWNVRSIKIPGIDISSTELRKRVKEKQQITYLTTDSVQAYIKENHLYEN
ncbi:nicotinate-nucleotide adenylyltransferase [Oceanobacillus manasiensis]|uniref:nicotinate-nucleotide adenylyltransferase n=1 Tax=Oceanobacillus manasiensis TaxID=586413 RepID=UPI0005A6B5EF|nr:nicotinate-nucleotide adenylyltransferase [Oceanobacillus manasiensis]